MERVWRKGASMLAGVVEAGARRRPASTRGGEQSMGASGCLDLDIEHLSRQTFGDPGLEDELLSLFDEQAAQILARLAAPFPGGDPARRADAAHALKGSALAIGAAATAWAADNYETALRRHSADAETHRLVLARTIEAARRAVAARRRALRQ